MACVGRQKVCSVVPPNHFGPIPGIEVGTLWKFRVQVFYLFGIILQMLTIVYLKNR